MAKTNVYHFRKNKIKTALDIPNEPHWALVFDSSDKVSIPVDSPKENNTKEESQSNQVAKASIHKVDYYVFMKDDKENMENLVTLLYDENPLREDVRIMKVEPQSHRVKLVVDFDFPKKEDVPVQENEPKQENEQKDDANNQPNNQ